MAVKSGVAHSDGGLTLNLREFAALVRSQWITICVAVIVAALGAVVVNTLTTPLYQASTRLFVSTTASSSLAEAYQGNRFSQERVKSYTELLMGRTLAQRTVDKLTLNMTPEELQAKVKATAKLDTVLINVSVLDASPVRARDIANALSDEFVVMARELEAPGTNAAPDARVVVEQRAFLPERPVVPKKARNIGIGVMLGIALGIGLALLRELLDNTVKDRASIEEITEVGLVGSIPVDKPIQKQPAISFGSDNSAVAESFRKLRTNLQFLSVDNPPRVIVVTSSLPSEGKTTTSTNIALALAEAGHNVVLVDGDMRRPMLHKYLDLVGQVGFSTVLSGQVALTEALQKTRFNGLTALTAGAVPPNPSALLGSQAAKTLLQQLRDDFEFVIVDSTPLLAVTDAAVLSSSADGVIILTRYAKTKKDQLAHAVDAISSVGAPLLGAVFTMMPMRGGGTYSYKYRTYGNVVETPTPSDPQPVDGAEEGSPASFSKRHSKKV